MVLNSFRHLSALSLFNLASRKWMTWILKLICRSKFKNNYQRWQKLSPSLKTLSQVHVLWPAVVSLSNTWLLAFSSKSSSVVPRISKSAGSVESWCVKCRSDQLVVLFRRRKDKAEAIYLLRREKVYPPISIHQKVYVHVSIHPSVKFNISQSILGDNGLNPGVTQGVNVLSKTIIHSHKNSPSLNNVHGLLSKLLYHAVNEWRPKSTFKWSVPWCATKYIVARSAFNC